MQLSNTLFEELAMDVFDEVDRRENECSEFTKKSCMYRIIEKC